MKTMTIALIDEYPIFRKGLDKVLNSHFEIAATLESNNTIDFHNSFPDQLPDIVIIGTSNVDKTILDSLRNIKKWYPSISIIVIDEKESVPMIIQYLRVGINGYLSKEADLYELVSCVNNIARGKKYIGSQSIINMLGEHQFNRRSVPNTIKIGIKLSKRELEIAEYISDGMTTSWISKRLDLKPSTISTFKRKIYSKLSVNNILDLRTYIIKKDKSKVHREIRTYPSQIH